MAATGVLVLVALALAAVLTAQWRTPAVPWHAWREAIVYLETSWPFSAAVLAPVVLVVGTGFTGLTKSESPGWWFVVNLVAYLLHQVEEHSLNWHSPTGTGSEQPWRQGFKQLIAKLFSPAASSDWNLLLVNVAFVWVPYAASIALAGNAWAEHKAREAIRKRADDEFQETGLPLAITLLRALHMPGAVCLGLSVANGFSHVVASALVLRAYGAGLLTAPLLLLVGALGLAQLQRERILRAWQVPLAVLAGALAHIPILILFHRSGAAEHR